MAKFCGQCGNELKEGATFCGECGAKVEQPALGTEIPQPVKQPEQTVQKVQPIQTPPPQRPVYTEPAAENEPKKKLFGKNDDDNMSETVKTGYFFGMTFLYAVPVIGWAICLFNALINKNKSKRNHARATVLTVLVMMAVTFAISFAVKTAVNVAIEKSGIDIDAIKENGISTEIVMDFLEDKGMIPEELADLAGFMDNFTGILGGEGDFNLEGINTEEINDILDQFTGEDGSMDIEALMGALQGLNPDGGTEERTE